VPRPCRQAAGPDRCAFRGGCDMKASAGCGPGPVSPDSISMTSREKPMFCSSRLFAGLVAGIVFTVSGAAGAMDDSAVGEVLDRRLLGDSSGACFAAAVIEGDSVARAWRCADPADIDRVGPDVAFEIGSVTKSMA